jgi:polar amino acid transport system substrate-binding protein
MLQRLVIAAMAIAAGLIAANSSLQAQTLDKIRQRGVVVIGTKADYKPFGFRDPSGAIVGFEPDLARDVAARLGVRLELEPVVSANRMQFLQQGKIDLMLATMNVTDERRKTVGIIAPSYYASGVNVFANRKVALKRWEALKGQKVCGIQGAFFNKYVAEKYGADIVAFRGQNEAETALSQGNCIAWLYDDTAFAERLADPKWAGFEMPLETILSVGRRREAGGARWAVGSVHGQDHRRLAPQRQAHRAREEVEHRAVRLPQESAGGDQVSATARTGRS